LQSVVVHSIDKVLGGNTSFGGNWRHCCNDLRHTKQKSQANKQRWNEKKRRLTVNPVIRQEICKWEVPYRGSGHISCGEILKHNLIVEHGLHIFPYYCVVDATQRLQYKYYLCCICVCVCMCACVCGCVFVCVHSYVILVCVCVYVQCTMNICSSLSVEHTNSQIKKQELSLKNTDKHNYTCTHTHTHKTYIHTQTA